ncbi:MAG: bifunctional aspartate kinase/homoserine dehydrogenase I [Marinilabiliaceae bacterium]|nr:bifunctional aspartate kinase/homoserine dehydrogenase I [Bacteroidales bacterium]MDD5816452.1 bifunctional aspartate kinase/homoserine dehydrogenase I [Bacteroidales bacterium]MDY4521488.1 bifunctional aspartate kinase/homoserine dehydrogenase I [Bacteroidales bacterium]
MVQVLKFGGTSMGTAKSIAEVKRIILSHKAPTIAVVSAVSGVTDMLLSAAKLASQGEDYSSTLNAIVGKHNVIVESLFSNPERVQALLLPLFSDLGSLLKGVSLLKELSNRSLDTISGFGERFSSLILSELMAGSKLVDSRPLIKTQAVGRRNIVIDDVTARNIAEAFQTMPDYTVMPGFISSNEANEPTTLGRGGSDYTAALVASALDAEVLEIWTDVDGFMSADPRVISRAYTLDHLTYEEAMELSHFGAKVIYPPTILPALKKRIPIYIKNTFNPTAPGTRIDDVESSDKNSKIRGISSIRDVSLLTFQMVGMVGISGVSMRIFKALADAFINVILISQASSELTVSFVVETRDADKAAAVIDAEFGQEIQSGHAQPTHVKKQMAVVAIVGDRMKHNTGVSGKLFDAVGKNGINIYAIAQGASEVNISFVIKEDDLRKTLNTVHDSFFLSRCQVLQVFLAGVGTVGGKLLEKLTAQADKLRNDYHLVIRIVGVANSKLMLVDEQGIDPAHAKERLKAEGQPTTPQEYAETIRRLNLAGSVFVDCTASADIAALYDNMLENNINVVTANKIASSSAYEHYLYLKTTARDKGVKFHYETNVGAALPIISPINDLIRSGDKVVKIEAVLSGTLNFISNALAAGRKLSEVIAEAKAKGYSEPDPRIDLSGIDVARKILIMAREAGYGLEMADIERTPFVPQSYLDVPDVETFMTKVAELDDEFDAKTKELSAKGLIRRYVATFENGKVSVGFKEVGEGSPLYFLDDTNNIVLINSDNYKLHPLEVKGYGAGADVTAAGVFADIIKVANLS